MDRPDCLSLSYSAGRLCYEDSKQMRSLHLLPCHASKKQNKTKQQTSSTQMATRIFLALIPKGSSPSSVITYGPGMNIAALCSGEEPRWHMPRFLSEQLTGTKVRHAAPLARPGGQGVTSAHAMMSTGKLQQWHMEFITN